MYTIRSKISIQNLNEIGKVIIIDLYDTDLLGFISLEEFGSLIRKANLAERIENLRIELSRLTVLKNQYAYNLVLWNKYYKETTLNHFDEMTGIDFERYILNQFIKKGFKAYMTKSTGDQGVDIIVENTQQVKIAIQVKKYSSKVGNSAIQEVAAGRKIYKCTEAWVITNSTFTPGAIQLAKANRVKLIDGFEMTKYFEDVRKIENYVPEFDEIIFQKLKPMAEKMFKVEKYDIDRCYTPYNTRIEYLNLELNGYINSPSSKYLPPPDWI